MTRLVVLSSLDERALADLATHLGDFETVRDLAALEAAALPGRTLLSYAVSHIVPPDLLARFGDRAYNLHAASPQYPGRDPHHFAIYEEAPVYGATLHRMTALVDDGPIVDVEMFDVPQGCRPLQLLAMATSAAETILRRAGPRLSRGERLEEMPGLRWGGVKRTRADFLAMCRVDPAVSAEALERLHHAFDGEGRRNLKVVLHGHTFRIDDDGG